MVPGKSSRSLGRPVRDLVRGIRDLQDLPEGSGARLEAVLATSVRVLLVVVGHSGNRTLQITNLGSIRSFIDQPVCRSVGRVVDAVTWTYRGLAPRVL